MNDSDSVYFYKGRIDKVQDIDALKFYYDIDSQDSVNLTDSDFQLLYIKNELKKVFQIPNLSFFLGAGCSSHIVDGAELGIPIISALTSQVYDCLIEEEREYIIGITKLDISADPFKSNIEKTLEVFQCFQFYLKQTLQPTVEIDALLLKIKQKIYEFCIRKSPDVLKIYEQFYRKIILREHSLNTLNIITSNYDLFSELALEKNGIGYCNGFAGYHERVFNPSTFNHIFAENIGNRGKRLSAIESYVYLLKLHGSISWFSSNDKNAGLYATREVRPHEVTPGTSLDELMIYPSPTKQNASLGSPYSDIFREFQKRIMFEENVLLTLGYSFSDEHINNIIFQALSSPRFRIIIFGDVKGKIQELLKLDDPRIWVIGGKYKGNKIHYFSEFVNSVLSDFNNDLIHEKLNKSSSALRELKRS